MQYSDYPRSRGVFVRRYTGESTPYTFQKTPIKLIKKWPENFLDSFSATDFTRADEHKDPEFYAVPRYVYHIDEGAVSALTNYYKTAVKPGSDILDICSSWVSHYPVDFPEKMGKISASGISRLELMGNDQLTVGFTVVDLNEEKRLPYEDGSFDIVTCVVSIDYLTDPRAVMKEINRVLRPGGKFIVSQSNRFFPSKVVNCWLRYNDRERLEYIRAMFKYTGGWKDEIDCWDITAKGDDARDPMYIVEGTKL